jgi:hypothetical protein
MWTEIPRTGFPYSRMIASSAERLSPPLAHHLREAPCDTDRLVHLPMKFVGLRPAPTTAAVGSALERYALYRTVTF